MIRPGIRTGCAISVRPFQCINAPRLFLSRPQVSLPRCVINTATLRFASRRAHDPAASVGTNANPSATKRIEDAYPLMKETGNPAQQQSNTVGARREDPAASVAPNANPAATSKIEDAYPLMKETGEDGSPAHKGEQDPALSVGQNANPSATSQIEEAYPLMKDTDASTETSSATSESSDPAVSVGQNANPSAASKIEQAYPLMQSASATNEGNTQKPGRKVGYWLLGTAGLVYSIVVLGGLTRLTESGLSITEWKPVTGSIPPLNAAQWEDEFELYRQSPEFKILNADLSLDEFKFIYNMEWSHRQLGRTIGLVFAVPALALIITKRYPARFKLKLAGIASLIGFQGFIGWWMVRSGLEQDIKTPRVSQYRLATHLGTAFLVYLSMLHTGLKVLAPTNPTLASVSATSLTGLPVFRRAVLAFGALTFLTALSGAFVAGLDAGLIYNDFPYMGNSYIPPISELTDRTLPSLRQVPVGFEAGPGQRAAPSETQVWLHNMFENPVLAQLDHRILAMTTFTAGFALLAAAFLGARRGTLPPTAVRGAAWLAALVSMQATLGITTLWYLVPTPLAAAHQAGSLAVLTGVVVVAAKLRVPVQMAQVARQAARQGVERSGRGVPVMARAGIMHA